MKFYGRMAIAIIALILLLLWLKEESEDAPAAATSPAAAVAAATPAAAVATFPPMPTATPSDGYARARSIQFSHAPTAPVSAPVASSGCQALAPAAQRAKVNVVNCGEQGGYTVITVWGYDRNNLNDFLDEAMRAGVRDIAPAQQYTQSILNGRQVFQNTFRFRF